MGYLTVFLPKRESCKLVLNEILAALLRARQQREGEGTSEVGKAGGREGGVERDDVEVDVGADVNVDFFIDVEVVVVIVCLSLPFSLCLVSSLLVSLQKLGAEGA